MGLRIMSNTSSSFLPNAAIVPLSGSSLIERERLDQFFAVARGRVVRVLAPAGYGKTTLVARWVRDDDRTVCWLEIARGDDDAVVLFAKLRDALASVATIPEPSQASAPTVNPYVEAVRAAFVDQRPEPFVLVLDDVHRLRSVATSWLLETLIECLPPESTVVLAGRGHHDHGTIGRLRLAPGVVDVTADDLRFDDSEVHRFLTSAGLDVGAPRVSKALAVLAGWPAGLRLATTAIQRGIDPPDAADHAELVEYLRSEWLVSLEPEDHEFLRELGCLQSFTGWVCDEVFGRTGSSRLLERLHRDQHLIFGLDQRGEWYRLHPLLSRWLAADLRSSNPARWTEVHVSAARFWEREHDIDRAVGHAKEVGDLVLLERLIVTHGGAFLTRGAWATVTNWLESLPSDLVRTSPGLCGVQCVTATHRGDEARARQWQRVLNDAVVARGHPDCEATTWWPNVISAALDERPARDLLPVVADARTHLGQGPWAAFACWVQGGLAFLDGDTDAALEALAAGCFEAELAGNPVMQSHCLATAAVIDECMGATQSMLDRTRRCAELLRSCGAEFSPPTAIDVAMMSVVAARDGDRERARHLLAKARRALAAFPGSGPWFNVIARIPLVRTALLLDDRDLCRLLLREAEHHARFEQRPLDTAPSGAMRCLAQLRQQVDAMHLPAAGASALTEAELRVLRLLPTNLSLGEMATRLFVSRNTVKSHAASIYRKLGASNRSQAVEAAAAAGLVEPT